jgi:L-cysteine desulfidase
MDKWDFYIDILKKEVVPALGCTEPISVALASAKARSILGKEPEKITTIVSANLLKNGMGVGVPGTGKCGLDVAAAVGALGGNPDRQLEVLADLNEAQVKKAIKMVEDKKVKVMLSDTPDLLYAEVILHSGEDYAKAVIKDSHTRIVLTEKNNEILFVAESNDEYEKDSDKQEMTLKDIYDFATQAPLEKIKFILDAANLNETVAKEGLNGEYGLQIGKTIDANIKKHLLCDDIQNIAVKLSAAASDARMDGIMLPVMSNSGSGNQGITCTMPVLAVAKKLNKDDDILIRALIMSHLTSIHIKHHLGKLSALCGVSVAATGAGCGIVMLLGGEFKQMEFVIKNMLGSIVGMICDGAKTGCALKVATAVNSGVNAALLSMNNVAISSTDGIVDDDVEQCIRNLGRLGSEGMSCTDKVILDIMTSKKGI